MFCPSCGTRAPDGARFCGNCRHELQAASTRPETARPAQPSPEPELATSRAEDVVIVQGKHAEEVTPMLKWGVVVASLLMPLIGIVMGLIYINKNGASEEVKSVGKMWLIAGIVFCILWAIGSSGGY